MINPDCTPKKSRRSRLGDRGQVTGDVPRGSDGRGFPAHPHRLPRFRDEHDPVPSASGECIRGWDDATPARADTAATGPTHRRHPRIRDH
jgi:hypothetical protein